MLPRDSRVRLLSNFSNELISPPASRTARPEASRRGSGLRHGACGMHLKNVSVRTVGETQARRTREGGCTFGFWYYSLALNHVPDHLVGRYDSGRDWARVHAGRADKPNKLLPRQRLVRRADRCGVSCRRRSGPAVSPGGGGRVLWDTTSRSLCESDHHALRNVGPRHAVLCWEGGEEE